MPTVTAAELQKKFGLYREIARKEAVCVTHHGRESLVVIAAEESKRLKAFDTWRAYFPHERRTRYRRNSKRDTTGNQHPASIT